jgi:hypothetical protein
MMENFDILTPLLALVSMLTKGGMILVAIILGVTQVAKKFGAKDKVALAVNIAIGLIFGAMIGIGTTGIPVAFGPWVVLILFCLLCSLVASGIYKLVPKE